MNALEIELAVNIVLVLCFACLVLVICRLTGHYYRQDPNFFPSPNKVDDKLAAPDSNGKDDYTGTVEAISHALGFEETKTPTTNANPARRRSGQQIARIQKRKNEDYIPHRPRIRTRTYHRSGRRV